MTVAVRPPLALTDEKGTTAGWLLAFGLALLAGSGFQAARVEFGGLLIHPFLFVVGALGLSALNRLHRFPQGVIGALALFTFAYTIAAIRGPSPLGEVVKLIASAATIVVCALSVRSAKDYQRAVLGLVLAGAALSVHGLTGLEEAGPQGINPMDEVANKNSFSLFVLPGLLLGAHRGLAAGVSKRERIFLAGALFAMVVAIFSTGNRSGYLGVVLIAGMLLVRRRNLMRAGLLFALLSAGGYVFMTQFGSTRVLERRLEQTSEGYESDDLRENLLLESISIGFENPVLGVGTTVLPGELARALRTRAPRIDPHNTFALLFGGGGFLLVLAFAYLGLQLWRFSKPRLGYESDHPVPPWTLLRMMLFLWLVRGFFTREILYNPAFSAGVGLCVGHLLWVESLPKETE